MEDKLKPFEEILDIAKKYDIKLLSIILCKDGNAGVIDMIGNPEVHKHILGDLLEQLPLTSEISESDLQSLNESKLPVAFLLGCMEAVMSHLDKRMNDSREAKYRQFLQGNVKELTEDELNEFLDRYRKRKVTPIRYINATPLKFIHILCDIPSVLYDLCEYLNISEFHFSRVPGMPLDLTVKNSIKPEDIERFLKSDIKYNIFKLEVIDDVDPNDNININE